MAATLHPTPRPDRSRTAPPPLRVIEGGQSPRLLAARYRRRRVLAAVVVVALTGLVLGGSVALLGVLRPEVPGAHPSPAAGTLAGRPAGPVVVVRPGDTLWTIARRLAPGGDVRATVDRLAAVHGTGPLHVGERLPRVVAGSG